VAAAVAVATVGSNSNNNSGVLYVGTAASTS
jgi:hypothetical protein